MVGGILDGYKAAVGENQDMTASACIRRSKSGLVSIFVGLGWRDMI
jgi:hypothetical protein